MASKITIDRGTTRTITGTITNGGAAVDITGATVFLTVKTAEFSSDTTDSDAIISKTITSFATPQLGLYTITINPVDTATIAKGTYYYDLKIKYVNGTIYKLSEGRIIIDASPTNRMT